MSFKGPYVPWRGSGTSSGNNNASGPTSTSSNQTNNSSASSSLTSKYSVGSSAKSEFQKQKDSSFSSSNTSSSSTATGSQSSTFSRFSSNSRSSLNSSSNSNNNNNNNSGSGNSSSLLTSSGSSLSTNKNSLSAGGGSASVKRESSFNSSRGDKNVLNSTTTASSIRDKYSSSTSLTSSNSGTTAGSRDKGLRERSLSRERSGLSAKSGSIKRERSNVGSEKSAALTNSINANLSNAAKLLSSLSSASNDTKSTAASSTSLTSSSSFRSSLRNGLGGSTTSLTSSTSNSTALPSTTGTGRPKELLVTSKLAALEDHAKKTIANSALHASANAGRNSSGSSSAGPAGYRLFSARNLANDSANVNNNSSNSAGADNNKPSGPGMSTSLRTTARFGLRSGSAHAHYSSHLPAAVRNSLGESAAGRLEAARSTTKNNEEPATWMSRGTSPSPPNVDSSANTNPASEISMDLVPSINPHHDITIVVKHKGVQTDNKLSPSPPTLHKYISSIPRPSTTYYSPFNAAMSRFSSSKSSGSSGSNSNETSSPSSSSNNEPKASNVKLPGSPSSSSSSDNKSRSFHSPSPHSSPSRNNNKSSQGNIIAENGNKRSTTTGNNSNNLLAALPNKEFRKSALNVELESREAEKEFCKKQEELRIFNKSQQQSQPVGGGIAGNKRDFGRRPPTDPNKSSSSPLNGHHQSRALNKVPGGLQKSASINPSALAKVKSGKLISVRKGSTSSTSESESSSSAANNNGIMTSSQMKKAAMNFNNAQQQGRRGSATSTTSCSSTASSRSSSSERSRSSSKVTTHSNNGHLYNHAHQVSHDQSNSPSPARHHHHEVDNSSPASSGAAAATTSEGIDGPSQSSFLLRALASTEERLAWVRRCESGELPWWMASNPNVPGLAKNPSSAKLSKCPTNKQIAIQEEISSAKSESDDSDEGGDDDAAVAGAMERKALKTEDDVVPLEERTSPDGTENLSFPNSPKTTLATKKKKTGAKKDPFIGQMTNIDDILGTFSPSARLLPTPKDPTDADDDVLDYNKNLRDTSNVENNVCSSDESESDEDDRENENVDDEDEDDDAASDDGSTGTSSSFEEVDPSSIAGVAPLPDEKAPDSYLNDSSSSRAVVASSLTEDDPNPGSLPISLTTSGSGLIPQSQREKLDDATLQIYKDGDYGTYLDLEASISEQQEEFDGFRDNRKNSIILRAQLPVRVHAIIEKLLNSDGRELRRALFSLKQIFQEDKDLVHEFVENGGLSCLIRVGSEADQNHQNYILRAIGQVMLYVDGMNGVMRHNETIQWLYSLVASKFRLVQKTALKLLLVFVDYVESNCLLLVQAVTAVDTAKDAPLWSNVMSLLREHDSGDTELLVYSMTLVNKVLNGIPDIDTYYDQVDALEEQGIANLIHKYMGKQCADLDLLQQFQIYEVVLKHEDGEEDNIVMQLDENMRQKLLNRKGYGGDSDGTGRVKERRKSRRHSANGTPPSTPTGNGSSAPFLNAHPTVRRLSSTGETRADNDEWSSSSPSSSHSSSPAPNGTPNGSVSPVILNGYSKDKCLSSEDVTPGLRRRRERAERQKTLQLEQKLIVNGKINGFTSECNGNGHTTDDSSLGSPMTPSSPVKNPDSISLIPLGRSSNGSYTNGVGGGSNKKDILSVVSTNGNDTNSLNSNNNNINGNGITTNNNNNNNNNTNKTAKPWISPYAKTNGTSMNGEKENSVEKEMGENEKNVLKRENTVKDLTQKLANQSLLTSPVDENKSFIRTGDLSGVVSKAKEGLSKSKSRVDIKPSQSSSDVLTNGNPNCNNNGNGILEVKKSDNELHWDFLVSNLNRPLEICDLDFKDLTDRDDSDILAPSNRLFNGGSCNGVNGLPPPPIPSMNGFTLGPPPPPPGIMGGKAVPPPPLFLNGGMNGALTNGRGPPAPPLFGISLKHNGQLNGSNPDLSKGSRKTKKTVKLFWKEVREDPVTAMKVQEVGCIWDELAPIPLDTQRLEHLFESRAKDVITKKQTDMNKSKEIVVLDPKRSNAINIGMTKLPPPRTIKAAIMKMDATIINREGIEKLLTMLPTEEERAKIQEAQFANPEIPLGSAEQFLLTLASISELPARLKLWAFKLDYENLEKEVAEPLMDLKQGVEDLQKNKTFRCILTTLLCIGNFLNNAEAKGFQIDYLAKVPEVKDTVHKHSLLHHLCHIVIEKFPESSDLYSEIGTVTRASRVDFDELAANLNKMETDCKASWDHLRVIAKHDGPTNMKLKMSEFLADCAERIIVLGIVHRRVMNRYHKFLLWLGVQAHQVTTTKPQTLFKTVSEFALEYRTTRERVIQQLQKKANHRERNKTRGKMITEQIMYKSKEDKADAELRQVLKGSSDTGGDEVVRAPLTWARRPKNPQSNNNNSTMNNNMIMNNNNKKSATLNGHGTLTDGDEILECLVKTATQTPATRAAPRERKRNNSRFTDRKSLRRTLRHGLSDEERKVLAAFMSHGHNF